MTSKISDCTIYEQMDKTQVKTNFKISKPDSKTKKIGKITITQETQPPKTNSNSFSKRDEIIDLLNYLKVSPTAWHATQETSRILKINSFEELDESKNWFLKPGQGYFVTRNGSSIIAFITPKSKPKSVNILGAHTDSPGLKLKPNSEKSVNNVKMLVPEVYAGPTLTSWFDRPLGLAGRITVLNEKGEKITHLIKTDTAIGFIAHVAIHLDHSLSDSHKINKQQHLPAIVTVSNSNKPYLKTLLKKIVPFQKLLGKELFLVLMQKPLLINDKLLVSAKLDNLLGCHASLDAFIKTKNPESDRIKMICFWDNEEVGSDTYQGASSNFLPSTLERITASYSMNKQEHAACIAKSGLISINVAHAQHPNYSTLHEPNHAPLMGEGPIIKYHANQSYATNSESEAWIQLAAKKGKIPIQKFCIRSDTRCGSTIGNIVAPRLGIRTVDIGAPILSMHSVLEKGSCQDHLYMCELLKNLLTMEF